jgi:hypothetical protein
VKLPPRAIAVTRGDGQIVFWLRRQSLPQALYKMKSKADDPPPLLVKLD